MKTNGLHLEDRSSLHGHHLKIPFVWAVDPFFSYGRFYAHSKLHGMISKSTSQISTLAPQCSVLGYLPSEVTCAFKNVFRWT